MKSVNFFEAIISERNRAGQGVRRDLIETEVPAEIRTLLQKQKINQK